jgi:hypothetical protein
MKKSTERKSTYKLSLESQIAGGHARAAQLTPERRREIARLGAITRWGKRKNQKTKSRK